MPRPVGPSPVWSPVLQSFLFMLQSRLRSCPSSTQSVAGPRHRRARETSHSDASIRFSVAERRFRCRNHSESPRAILRITFPYRFSPHPRLRRTAARFEFCQGSPRPPRMLHEFLAACAPLGAAVQRASNSATGARTDHNRRPAAAHVKCDEKDPPHYPYHPMGFKNYMGAHDIPSVRRGYEVYRQVCATCHSMRFMAFRRMVNQVSLSSTTRAAYTTSAE